MATEREIEEVKEKYGVEVRHVDGMRDRLWCTLGKKIQVVDYEPVDTQIGYATDQKAGETLDDTARRCIKAVQRYIKPLLKEIANTKSRLRNNH
jgi:hypothetical protein